MELFVGITNSCLNLLRVSSVADSLKDAELTPVMVSEEEHAMNGVCITVSSSGCSSRNAGREATYHNWSDLRHRMFSDDVLLFLEATATTLFDVREYLGTSGTDNYMSKTTSSLPEQQDWNSRYSYSPAVMIVHCQ